ncbi:MAG: tetratricopeptide repeat protein [Bacteroidales bacterium]
MYPFIKKIFITPLLLFPFIWTTALCDNAELTPDSIKKILEESDQEERLDLLIKSSEEIIQNHPQIAIEYAKSALNLAKQNDQSLVPVAQYLIARGLYVTGDYGNAVKHLDNAHDYYKSKQDSLGLVKSHQLFGQIYTRIGDFKKALDNTQIAFNIAGSLGDREIISDLSREIGNIYFYFDEKDIALDFFEKSLRICREINYSDGIAKANNNIGRIYSEMGRFDEALEALKKSLNAKSVDEDRVSYGNTLLNIGTVHLKRNDYQKALEFLHEAHNNFSAVNNSEGIANSLYYIGVTNHRWQRYNQAIATLNESWRVASSTDSKRLLVNISEAQSKVYADIGDFRRAYNLFNTYNSLRDTVFSNEKAKLLIELETRYQLHAKQRQIELLSKEKELKDSEKQQSRIWIALLSIATLFFVSLTYFIYSRFRYKSKANDVLKSEIKHRMSVEAQLNEYQDHLENIVEERTWELKVAKEKAEESDKLKTAFLTNMSHEIRTPMNAIVGFSHLLTDPESTQQAKDEYIKIIKSNGEVLMNLINDILDISIIEAGQLKTKFKPVAIIDLLDELKSFYCAEAEKHAKEVSVRTDYDPDLNSLTIITDRVRLRQVLLNLLSNALKFTSQGVITLGYRRSSSDELIFFVKDTGPGIAPEKHDAIFDRFSKFGKFESFKDKQLYSGTGLGLAICKELVRLLGGKIWLDSCIGKGTTFYFTIPYNPEKEDCSPEKANREELPKSVLKNKTVLIAEDVVSNYQLISAFLSNSDVNIIWAKNGQEAVDLFNKKQHIDIILMDVQMPVMDGLKALRQIRKVNKEVPIIVNSAFYLTDEMEKSFSAGCTDYMTKPIRKEDLLVKLITHLRP